jgi:hypothetical protein
VDFARVFEMPLLGYGGYLPFALELFALYHLIVGFLRPKRAQTYLRISPDESWTPGRRCREADRHMAVGNSPSGCRTDEQHTSAVAVSAGGYNGGVLPPGCNLSATG